MTFNNIKLFIKLSRPHFLLGAALTYALGVGIARFLGTTIDWGIYLVGQIWVTAVQLNAHFMNEYYDAPGDQDNPNRTPFSGGSGAIGPDKLPREVAMWAGITCLAIAASITVLLIRLSTLDLGLVLIMGLIFIGAFFYSTPPIRLAASGYGELSTSIIVANLVPAFAFLLQFGEFHRLLTMATFPLMPIHLGMMIAFEFPDYGQDIKFLKLNILTRMGWERGVVMHNLMILAGYFILGIATVLGLPFRVAFPGFLSLPLGLFQIWMLNRIADGGKPNWHALTFTAVSVLGITTYLLTFSFWTR
jgi:1,4-dihydroxy-2-naphthoate octaprenyltransferase